MDNCCYNRPYDDQNQIRIELETKAKLFVQKLIADREVGLAVSYMSYFENNDNPFAIRKSAIRDFFKYAAVNIEESQELLNIAGCECFLSTDDRLLKYSDDRIRLMNPINFTLLWEGTKHE